MSTTRAWPVFVGPSTSSSPAPLVFTVPTLRRTCSRPASRSTSRQRRTNASPRRIEASTTDGRAQGDGAGEDLHPPQQGPVFADKSLRARRLRCCFLGPYILDEPPTFGCELFRERWRLDTLQL